MLYKVKRDSEIYQRFTDCRQLRFILSVRFVQSKLAPKTYFKILQNFLSIANFNPPLFALATIKCRAIPFVHQCWMTASEILKKLDASHTYFSQYCNCFLPSIYPFNLNE